MKAKPTGKSAARSNGAKPKQIKRITDLEPDPQNSNRHTQRGSSMMESSIRDCGFGDSLTVDRDGVVISGGQRLETLADLQMENPIVVQSDGTRPVIHQRTDLTAKESRAKMLGIYSNRVGELNLEWDPAILKQLSDEGLADLDKFFTSDELVNLIGDAMGDAPITDEQARKTLAERFGVPPFSILDARQGYWQERKRAWIARGIKSELGRGGLTLGESPEVTEPGLNYYRNQNKAGRQAGRQAGRIESRRADRQDQPVTTVMGNEGMGTVGR
jgi:hypothetical protein